MRDYAGTLIGVLAMVISGIAGILGLIPLSVTVSAALFAVGVFVQETLISRDKIDKKSYL